MFLLSVLAGMALVASLGFTPIVRRIAIKKEIYAVRNHRTIHQGHIPNLGGLAISVTFVTCLSLCWLCMDSFLDWWGVILGSVVVLLTGLIDDLHEIECNYKLLGQSIGALIAIQSGVVMDQIYIPLLGSYALEGFAIPLTFLWILTVTNALNLIDGVDGLATGFSVIVALFVFIGATATNHFDVAAIALILGASALGFLPYNFSTARIFLGDNGSLYLGYLLSIVALRAFSVSDGVNILAVVTLLFIPLFDTVISILRRLSRGQHPFVGDREHLHHRLLMIVSNQRTAVFLLFGATFFCGVVSLVVLHLSPTAGLLSFLCNAAVFFFAGMRLGCFDSLSLSWRSSGFEKLPTGLSENRAKLESSVPNGD